MASAIAPPLAAIDRTRRARLFNGLIWAFCLLLIAGSWWFVAAQIAFERRVAIEDAIRQNENRTIAFEQYVRRTLEAADLVTRYVSARFARGAGGGEFAGTPGNPARIAGNIARGGTFLGVSVANADGDIVGTSVPLPSALANVADRPAFRAHVGNDGGGLFISPPSLNSVIGRNVLWLSRRMNYPDGSFAGVIAISILPEQLTGFYSEARVGPNDLMSVIGLDGMVRARRIGQATTSGEDARGGPVMREQSQRTSGTYLGPSRRDGVMRYISHRRLRDYPLFVTYGVPEAEILALPRYRARIFIAAAALLSVILIAFAAQLTLVLGRRQRRAAEMAQANRRLEEAQRIGQIGDWTYDLRTGATYWSPQVCRQFERTPEQGSPTFEEFRSYLNDDGRAAVDRAHAEAIRTGQSQEIEYEVRLPSGAVNRHQAWVMPTFDAAGHVVGLHGTDQNITGRKLLEQLQARVTHLSRVEAMNAMATTLAHELNQPLAAAVNYLAGSRHHLEAVPADPGGASEGLAAAEQQIHFAGDIIRRVREMVANQPRLLSSFSLAPVIDDALTLIAGAQDAAARPKVTKRLAPDARRVRADRVQVQQVLINLLGNALEATRTVSPPDIVVASRRHEGGMILISVSDDGSGFTQPAEERFSPFTARAGGMGLGLSISRTIVESHGGRIWTEDPPGGGAIVHFTLPAVSERAARNRAEPEAASA